MKRSSFLCIFLIGTHPWDESIFYQFCMVGLVFGCIYFLGNNNETINGWHCISSLWWPSISSLQSPQFRAFLPIPPSRSAISDRMLASLQAISLPLPPREEERKAREEPHAHPLNGGRRASNSKQPNLWPNSYYFDVTQLLVSHRLLFWYDPTPSVTSSIFWYIPTPGVTSSIILIWPNS